MIRVSRTVHVHDASEVASARRVAVECAAALHLSETSNAMAALVATELATNLIKHAEGGDILFGSDDLVPGTLITVAIDKGRGIANVPQAMSDGFSTAGSSGTGLGAVERNSTAIDVYVVPGKGTAILSRISDQQSRATSLQAPPRIAVGGLAIPKRGETHCGDSWTAVNGRDVCTVGVADGLGHGAIAATASIAAVRTIVSSSDSELVPLMEDTHGALRPTRGAAVGLARIHASHGRVDFLGVGNIAGTIVADEAVRRTVSSPGIVGHEMRKVQVFSYPWTASSVLILQSDGIATSWSPHHYPGLMQHDPALIAAVIYRDHCRGTDDATVVVAKAT